jgi:hypothetical protein
MGVLSSCNHCGHSQLIGHGPDGRVRWWTQCKQCNRGDFSIPPGPREIAFLAKAFHRRPRPNSASSPSPPPLTQPLIRDGQASTACSDNSQAPDANPVGSEPEAG